MVNVKICTKCKESKQFSDFNRSKLGKFGLKALCKTCQAKEARHLYERKKGEISDYGKKYREKERHRISAQRAIHTVANKERLAEYGAKWRRNNPGKVNAKTARRRAQKRSASPSWLTEDHWTQIENFYIQAAELKIKMGIPYEVDHEIPLRGKNVSGLHVPWNLRVITKSENRRKSYKTIV